MQINRRCVMKKEYSVFHNPDLLSDEAEQGAQEALKNLRGWQTAVDTIKTWPGYAPTPLWQLDHRAADLGVGKIFYKDESQRFGRKLGAFKALGAPYTIFRILSDIVEEKTGTRPTADQLRSGEFADLTKYETMAVATDGNQGRGVAWGASMFGCRAVDYIHETVSEGRKRAMEEFGAVVIRCKGEHEASAARGKEDAAMNGWHYITSTSWDNWNEEICRDVMHGYMTTVEEALDQIPDLSKITHVFCQCGVGSIAAAVFFGFAERLGFKYLPRFIIVEPTEAACMYRSAVEGKPTPADGTMKTIQAGLACRVPSTAAWNIHHWLCSDFVTVPDEYCAEGMRALAEETEDVPIVIGESSSGSMGLIMRLKSDNELREKLGVNEDSQLVLFALEGATDPELYEKYVGSTPEEVFERQDRMNAKKE